VKWYCLHASGGGDYNRCRILTPCASAILVGVRTEVNGRGGNRRWQEIEWARAPRGILRSHGWQHHQAVAAYTFSTHNARMYKVSVRPQLIEKQGGGRPKCPPTGSKTTNTSV